MILIIIVITISAPDLRRLDPDTGQELEVKMSQSPTEELMSASNTKGHRERKRVGKDGTSRALGSETILSSFVKYTTVDRAFARSSHHLILITFVVR